MNTITLLLWAGVALAAPPGFRETKQSDGCTLYLGPAESDGVVPMAADCVWPDVTFEAFEAKLAPWQHHDRVFSTVVSSDLVRTEGATSIVKQRHHASGISDREIIIAGTRTSVSGGGVRFSWKKKAEAFTPASGNVEATRSEGYWQAVPLATGGIKVTYELRYDPGGSVPSFLVRWFQTSGLVGILGDLHKALKS
jgi:hypothetical protein